MKNPVHDARSDLDKRIEAAIESQLSQYAAMLSPEDRTRQKEIDRFSQALHGHLDDLTASSSWEKRKELETFFWMIEEYKVSLFAQELKTAIPISAKRLERKLKEIERMA